MRFPFIQHRTKEFSLINCLFQVQTAAILGHNLEVFQMKTSTAGYIFMYVIDCIDLTT